ncbi:unnamed protein product [Urochloa decumbens]|uniref:DUF3615 domain-containing protein n=2 Tax=Urochloa decumbens TaxID=240449 RepID=A0ABC9ER09_9POAL
MPVRRSGRSRRCRGGDHESIEKRFCSSCQGDGKVETKPAQTVQMPTLSTFQSKPVAPPWQPSGRCLTLSLGSRVWERLRRDWGRSFSIRLDLQGCFHTYPDVGGPFQNLQEVDKAIHRYLENCRDSKMCVEKGAEFSMERAVRQSLYYPDGTIRKRTRSYVVAKGHDRMYQVVQALVDKYNEDHNLVKDDAHKLKDVLHCGSIYENKSWYYHLNFTTNKGASTDNLIFAEVKCMPQGQHKELLVCCFCTVNVNDNGQHCYGCTNQGKADTKHPDSSVEYIAGHLDVRLPFGAFAKWVEPGGGDVKYVKKREAELRHMYKGLDEPGAFKRLFTLPPGVTIVGR